MASVVENVLKNFCNQLEASPKIDPSIAESVTRLIANNQLPSKDALLKALKEGLEGGQYVED